MMRMRRENPGAFPARVRVCGRRLQCSRTPVKAMVLGPRLDRLPRRSRAHRSRRVPSGQRCGRGARVFTCPRGGTCSRCIGVEDALFLVRGCPSAARDRET